MLLSHVDLLFHRISEAVDIETWFDIDKTHPEPTIDCRKKKNPLQVRKEDLILYL